MQQTLRLPPSLTQSKSLPQSGIGFKEGWTVGPPPPLGACVSETNYVNWTPPDPNDPKVRLDPIPPDIEKIKIRYLPTAKLNFDSRAVLCGPTKCGKTSQTFWMLLAMQFPRIVCQCGSPEASKTYPAWIPRCNIIPKFDERFLRTILVHQLRFVERITKLKQALKEKLFALLDQVLAAEEQAGEAKLQATAVAEQWSDAKFERKMQRLLAKQAETRKQDEAEIGRFCDDYEERLRKEISIALIFDDLGSDGDLKHSLIRHLMNNGRHYCAFVGLLIQEPVQLPKPSRSGVDWVFPFDDVQEKNIEFQHENYLRVFPRFKDLRWYVRRAKKMRGCIVMRKNHGETDFDKCVYYMQSGPIPPRPPMMGDQLDHHLQRLFFSESQQKKFFASIGNEFLSNGTDKKKKAGKAPPSAMTNTNVDEIEEAFKFHADLVKALSGDDETHEMSKYEQQLDNELKAAENNQDNQEEEEDPVRTTPKRKDISPEVQQARKALRASGQKAKVQVKKLHQATARA